MLHKFLNFVFCPQCTHNVLFCKTNQKKCMQNKVKCLKREKKHQKQYSYSKDKTVLFHAAGCND